MGDAGGAAEPQRPQRWEPGAVVWAAVHGFPPWPAQVMPPELAPAKARRLRKPGHTLVSCFGDSSFCWVTPSRLSDFDASETSTGRRGGARGRRQRASKAIEETLQEAVEQATEVLQRRRGEETSTNHRPYDFLNPPCDVLGRVIPPSADRRHLDDALETPITPRTLAACSASQALAWLKSIARADSAPPPAPAAQAHGPDPLVSHKLGEAMVQSAKQQVFALRLIRRQEARSRSPVRKGTKRSNEAAGRETVRIKLIASPCETDEGAKPEEGLLRSGPKAQTTERARAESELGQTLQQVEVDAPGSAILSVLHAVARDAHGNHWTGLTGQDLGAAVGALRYRESAYRRSHHKVTRRTGRCALEVEEMLRRRLTDQSPPAP